MPDSGTGGVLVAARHGMCAGELASYCSKAGAELGAASGAIAAAGKPGATVSGASWIMAGSKQVSIVELDVSPSSGNVVSGSGEGPLAASLGRRDEKMSRMALPNDNLFFSKDGFRVWVARRQIQ